MEERWWEGTLGQPSDGNADFHEFELEGIYKTYAFSVNAISST